MPLGDALKDILKQLAMQAPQQGLGALSQAMLAQGSPLAYQQGQETQRQRAALAQQLQMHNTMTPYEQAALQIQQQSHDQAKQQQDFENQLKVAQGISGGNLQQVFGPQQKAQFGSDGGAGDILNQLGISGTTVPGYTDPKGVINAGGIQAVPKLAPKAGTFTVTPDSTMGKMLGITQPIDVPTTDALHYGLTAAEKQAAEQQKEGVRAIIETQRQQLHKQIDQRFRPEYYAPLYQGKVDPEMGNLAKDMHAQLDTSAAADSKGGFTMTQIDAFNKQLREFKSPWEQMMAKKQEKDTAVEERRQARADTRSDRSYQFNITELDKAEKPVEDAVSRFSRLRDSLDQKTPQADALIAPELLTVMAGGAGSGLRMNEAEIARMVGGRSVWQDIQATLNKIKLNPKDALSIPDAQRAQIRSLMKTVGDKLIKKQKIMTDARSQIVNSGDISQRTGTDEISVHRKAMDAADKAMKAIDGGDMEQPQHGDPMGIR